MKKQKMPPTHFAISLAMSIILHFIFPGKILITVPYTYAGVVPIAAGIILNLWADSHFKKEKTTVKPGERPSSLLHTGPFGFTRNPMYLGMAMILLGTAIFLGSISSFLFPILFIMMMESEFIYEEEKHLEKAFGEKYKEYSKRTRKWI